MKIGWQGSDLRNFLHLGLSNSFICAQRNTGMWYSVACHDCGGDGHRLALEPANLVGVYPESDCHTR